ncbi:hypothetical protein SEA_ODAY_51 [Gordonia phage ODay]|nr:hypothetical protein SEA_ODAY_51 [Gordonia phage ODay]
MPQNADTVAMPEPRFPAFGLGERVRVSGTDMYGKVGAVGLHRGIPAFVIDLLGPRQGEVHLSLTSDLEHID